MMFAEGSVRVGAAPREVLELACDLRAYMALDELARIKEHFEGS